MAIWHPSECTKALSAYWHKWVKLSNQLTKSSMPITNHAYSKWVTLSNNVTDYQWSFFVGPENRPALLGIPDC